MLRIPAALPLSALLLTPGAALAQAAPANVVTPVPPPREGTVGPEQLRDFRLPGTRAPTPGPATVPATSAPTPRQTAPERARPQPTALPQPRPAPSSERGEAPAAEPPSATVPRAPDTPPSVPEQASADALDIVSPSLNAPLPAPVAAEPSAPLPAVVAPAEASLPWWPWLLAAVLAGVAAFLVLRRRRTAAPAGVPPIAMRERASEPAAAPPVPRPSPPPPARPQLPSGLVTTRLRGAAPPARPTPEAAPSLPAGTITSTRLRPWLDLELEVAEIELTAGDVVLRFRLTIANVGQAPARDVAIEAIALNAGEEQVAELTRFFARPVPEQSAIDLLARAATTQVTHEVRMPRTALREYEHEGRRLFVPILAFTLSYRWSGGDGRTGRAYLVGHQRPGAERLAPIRLDDERPRIGNLASRLLDGGLRR